MPSERRRRRLLVALLAATAIAATVVLFEVLSTVVFAITVAYVLFPLRQWLVDHGRGQRVSAATATLVGLFVSLLVVAPLIGALYVRRRAFIAFIRELPPQLPVSAFGFEYVIDVSAMLQLVQSTLTGTALSLAAAMPIIALKAGLFFLLVYALLIRPHDINAAVFEFVPSAYHDVVVAFDRRIRSTLYAIYVLQAATAFGTFLIGWAVFSVLGYETALVLGVFAGLLQFIPIVGPSVLVIVLAGYELSVGDTSTAILVTALGLVLIGFLPDALIRPRLATLTAGMPGSLYFVGFTGGVLTVGLVGLIAGPLVVGLLLEAAILLTAQMGVEPTAED